MPLSQEMRREPRMPSSRIHEKLLKIGWTENDIVDKFGTVAVEIERRLRDFVISPPPIDPLDDTFFFSIAPVEKIPVELVADMVFAPFAKPTLRSKVVRTTTTTNDRLVGYSSTGSTGRMDWRRTALRSIAREQAIKQRGLMQPKKEDENKIDFSNPQFRVFEREVTTQESQSTGAVIFIAKDVGYGNNKRETAARSIAFWMPRFFERFYDEVEVRYLLQATDDIASTGWSHMREVAKATDGNQSVFTSNVNLYRRLNEVFVPAFKGFDPYLFHLYSSDSTRPDDKIAFDNARRFIQSNGTIFFGDFRQDKYRPSTFRDEIARLRPLDQARTVVLEPGSDILADMFKVWFASVYEPPAFTTSDTY